MVSWDDAVEFSKRLAALTEEAKSGRSYRLPTEAEWEYSCRGGASSYQIFNPFGNSLSPTQANFDGNYPYGGAGKGVYLQRTCKVGSYPANGYGLYDMHGNVWEWCADWYDAGYYANSPRQDPPGPAERPRLACSAAAAGSTTAGAAGQRTATGPGRATGTTLIGFRLAAVPSLEPSNASRQRSAGNSAERSGVEASGASGNGTESAELPERSGIFPPAPSP